MKSTGFLITAVGLALSIGMTTQSSAADSSAWEQRQERRLARLAARSGAVPPATAATAATPSSTTFTPPGLVGKGYPEGRGWSAVEADFNDLRGRVDAIKSDTEELLVDVEAVKGDTETILVDVEAVKGDTESILLELEDVDSDLNTALRYLRKIDEDIATLGEGVAAVIEGVDALNSVLKLEVSVSTRDAMEMNAEAVWAFVHVSQNGNPVPDLEAGAFSFASSFGPGGVIPPDGISYCGDACFQQGVDGAYYIALSPEVEWEAGDYAGTVVVSIDDSATGSSLVKFKVPAEPAPAP